MSGDSRVRNPLMMLPPPRQQQQQQQHVHSLSRQPHREQQQRRRKKCCCDSAGFKAAVFLVVILGTTSAVVYWLYVNNVGNVKRLKVKEEVFVDLEGKLRPMSELEEVKRKNRQIEDFYFRRDKNVVVVEAKGFFNPLIENAVINNVHFLNI